MPFKNINLGLTLTVPTAGTTNWAANLETLAWNKISSHDHSGSGNGATLGAAALGPNVIDKTKLALNVAFNTQTLTPTGTTQTIDWDLGNIAVLNTGSASGDVTLTIQDGIVGGYYKLIVVTGATLRTIILPASVLLPGNVDPGPFIEASTTTVIDMYFDGTNYLATWNTLFS